MDDNKKKKLFIALNLIIFISMVVSVVVTLVFGSWASRKDVDGSLYGMKIDYWMHVVSFTILSNIMLGIIALVSAILGINCYKKKKELPKGLLTWYLIGATSGTLTCLTVVFFLAPLRAASGRAYFDMLLGPMFHLHFFNPLLAVISYIFFSGKQRVTLKARLLALLPIIIYSAPYIICVAILHVWPDFYNLTFGGQYHLLFLVYIVVMGIVFGISSLLSFCHNRYNLGSKKQLQPVEKSKDA